MNVNKTSFTVTMERPKLSKDWCCVHQCKYDGCKRGKYTYMNDVELFTFPGKKRDPNSRKKMVESNHEAIGL